MRDLTQSSPIMAAILAGVLSLLLSGCGAAGAALGGAALGGALSVGSRALDGADQAAEAADDYLTEGVAWRRELCVQMKDAVREKCGDLEGDEAIACWHAFYPTVRQLRQGIFGKPLETGSQ